MSVGTNTAAHGVAGSRSRISTSDTRPAGIAFMISGAIGLTVAVLADSALPSWGRHHGDGWVVSGVVMTIADALFVVALLALVRSAVLGTGRLRSWALAVALIGGAGVVVAEIGLRVDYSVGQNMFTAVGPLQGFGMVLIGAAVLKAGVMRGWARWPALLTGAYVFAVLGPALAASGGQNLPALAGLHALIILTGISFSIDTHRRPVR